MTTVPNRYVECRLVPLTVGEDKPMARERVLFEHRLGEGEEPIEAGAQINRCGGDEDARGGREVQHERRRASNQGAGA